MMKVIIFILLAVPSAFARPCVSDPIREFKKEFQLPPSVKILPHKIDLNQDDLMDLRLSSEEQCGAHSCEGSVYWQKTNGCYLKVLDFDGSLKVLSSKESFKKIKINKRIYRFNQKVEVYE